MLHPVVEDNLNLTNNIGMYAKVGREIQSRACPATRLARFQFRTSAGLITLEIILH